LSYTFLDDARFNSYKAIMPAATRPAPAPKISAFIQLAALEVAFAAALDVAEPDVVPVEEAVPEDAAPLPLASAAQISVVTVSVSVARSKHQNCVTTRCGPVMGNLRTGRVFCAASFHEAGAYGSGDGIFARGALAVRVCDGAACRADCGLEARNLDVLLA
jgi:hypothetical protein